MKLLLFLLLPLAAFGQLVSGTIASGTFGGAGATSAPPVESWSPTNSVFLRAWFEADDLDATLDDGNNVSTWANKASTGTANDLVTWPSRNPVFQADEWNGHDAVNFAGTDSMTNSGIYIVQPWTMLLVGRFTAVPSGAQQVIAGTNATFAGLLANTGYIRAGAGTNVQIGAGTTNWTVFTITATGGQGIVYSNGTSVATGDIGTNPINGVQLGALGTTAFFNGFIGTLAFFATNLPVADVASAYSYCTNLYPIQ